MYKRQAVDRDFEIRQQQGDGQTDQPQLHAFIAEIDEAAILTRSGQAAGIQANAGNQQAHRTADADLDVFGQAPCCLLYTSTRATSSVMPARSAGNS